MVRKYGCYCIKCGKISEREFYISPSEYSDGYYVTDAQESRLCQFCDTPSAYVDVPANSSKIHKALLKRIRLLEERLELLEEEDGGRKD